MRACIRTVLGIFVFMQAAIVQAAEAARPTAPGLDAGYFVQLVIGLVIVFGAIALLAWGAKRVPGLNAMQGQAGGRFRVVAALSLGTRERAVILQVGDKQVLVGVTTHGMNTLLVLDEPILTEASGRGRSEGESFAQRLKAALGREG